MKKVLFAITSLGAGGAEKVLVDLIAHLDREKYEVHVLSIYNEGFYIPEVKKYAHYHYGISLSDAKSPFDRLINRMKVAFVRHAPSKLLYILMVGREKYDIEVAFLEGWATKLISSSVNKSRKIAWVHTDMINNPHADSAYHGYADHRRAYEQFDYIVCVASETKQKFEDKFPEIRCEVSVCKNPIDIEAIQKNSKEDLPKGWRTDRINILTVGRLVKVKGFERLIDACISIAKENDCFHLHIIGDGELKEQLEKQARPLIDRGLCSFWGFQQNPYKFMEKADLCISSSYTEGAPVFLCEALVLRKLIIATRCPGTVDVLHDGKYGIICENSDLGIQKCLREVLLNYDLYKHRFSTCYPESIAEYRVDYVAKKVMNKYMECNIE